MSFSVLPGSVRNEQVQQFSVPPRPHSGMPQWYAVMTKSERSTGSTRTTPRKLTGEQE